MKCCRVTAKYSVFVFNLLVFIAGVILLVVGIMDKVTTGSYRNIMPEGHRSIALAPILTIVIGTVAILVSFFGCFGAIIEKPVLLTIFVILVAIIFFLQIIVGIVAFATLGDTESMEEKTGKALKKIFDKYSADKTGSSKDVVHLIQREMKCCGVNGPDYWATTGQSVPPGSCTDKSTKQPYKDGCVKKFCSKIYKSIRLIGITVLTVTALEILGLLIAIYLGNAFRNADEDEDED